MEALKDGLLAEVRPLMILGGCQQATCPSRCLYYERDIDGCRFTKEVLVLAGYPMRGLCTAGLGPPKLSAKAKSAANKRRHESRRGSNTPWAEGPANLYIPEKVHV